MATIRLPFLLTRTARLAPVRSPRARLAFGVSSSLLIAAPLVAMPLYGKPLDCASDRAYAMPASSDTVEINSLHDRPSAQSRGLESEVNPREMGFGAVCGICVGIFVKKGLKIIAFCLGGTFILLQYLSSRSFITIHWPSMSSSYDKAIQKRGGSELGVWHRFVDFVSADVQGRGMFLAGLGLGLRIG